MKLIASLSPTLLSITCLIISKLSFNILCFFNFTQSIFLNFKIGSLILPSWQLSCNSGTLGESVTQATCAFTYCMVIIYLMILKVNLKKWIKKLIFIIFYIKKTTTATVNSALLTKYSCSASCTAACNSYGGIKCCNTDNCNTGTANCSSGAASFKPIMSQMFLVVSFGLFYFVF